MSNWPTVRLGDISDLITKGTTPTSVGFKFIEAGINFVKIESISLSGEFIPRKFASISIECHESLKRSQLQEGDILFSIAGALGRTALVSNEILPANTNQALAIIRLKKDAAIEKPYLILALTTGFTAEQIEKHQGGVAQLNLSLGQMKTFEIPLPPIPEQQRIVAILDQAFADIEKARANAEQNLKNARDLFDSYLQKVFSQSGEGWVETTLGRQVDLITGYAFKSKDYTEHAESIPLIRGDNVIQGQLRWDNAKRWPQEKTQEYAKYQLELNDVVLAMDRTWVKAGMKYAKITHDDLPSLLVQRVARLRTVSNFDDDYLFHLLGSKLFESYILSIQTGLGVPHISGKQIAAFEFQKPTLGQQKEIISNVNRLSKEVEQLKRLYIKKLLSLDELKKSLLQKAFSGELTKSKGIAA